MENNKKISKAGSITLPAYLRRDLGIDQGEKFKIIPQHDGNIVLHRLQGECIFCKSESELIVYQGRHICTGCISKMTIISKERSANHE